MARSLSIFEYPEMEESLTAWTSFLAPDVQRYAEGARGEMAVIQQLLRPGRISRAQVVLIVFHGLRFLNVSDTICTNQFHPTEFDSNLAVRVAPPARDLSKFYSTVSFYLLQYCSCVQCAVHHARPSKKNGEHM